MEGNETCGDVHGPNLAHLFEGAQARDLRVQEHVLVGQRALGLDGGPQGGVLDIKEILPA